MEEFEEFYRRERPRVFGSLLLIVRDRDVAMDATDEAFVRALERWERVGTMEAPGGWLHTTALNLARRQLRRRALERRLHLRVASTATVPDGMNTEVWEALGALPHRQRVAVALRYLADLPEREIAAVMGIARGTVSASLVAARRS